MIRSILATVLLLIAPSTLSSQFVVVKYAVEGGGKASLITYTNEDGGMSQLRDVPLPWQEIFIAQSEFFASLSAQNEDANTALTTKIYSRKMKTAELKERNRRMARITANKLTPAQKQNEIVNLTIDLVVDIELKKQSRSVGAFVISSVSANLK